MKLLSVDFQNDFVAPGGVHYNGQPCVDFVADRVVPYARAHGLQVAEIVSDYRSPDHDDAPATCAPGRWGYESAIPGDLVPAKRWVKASIAPTWVRDGGGRAEAVPGPARLDPQGFTNWLETVLGPPAATEPVVLIGLMLEVCVLAALIEVRLRGYPAAVLFEGVDTADGDQLRKTAFLNTLSGYWGSPLNWEQFCAADLREPESTG